ncbi:MAG: PilZ domain-containing protein, partial [Candidatus Omnitrophota bacterium]
MQERRKITRWSIHKPVEIKLSGAETFIEAQLLDINFKGLQISLKPKLPKDTVVKFLLVLSKDLTLEIEAWVMWQRTIDVHNIYGLYFTKVSDNDKEKIYKFIYKHSPQEIVK